MPALNSYAFEALTHILYAAREAFLEARLRPEKDVEEYAGRERALNEARDPETNITIGSPAEIKSKATPITFAAASQATAARPEDMAYLVSAYITALYGYKAEPFNGAFRRARESLGRSDMVDGLVLFAALGHTPDTRSGSLYDEASYR